VRTKFVTTGGWRTLETFWGQSATGFFHLPGGADIRVRYGGNKWWNSSVRQEQTLNGDRVFSLSIGSIGSLVRARMQMRRVKHDQDVTYHIITGGVVSTPKIPF